MKYVILSDIHANYTALTAVLERLEWLRHATGEPLQFRFLGDVVGYGPVEDAVDCIKWLHYAPQMKWIPGNHDEWILTPNGGVRFSAKVTLLSQRILLQRLENEEEWNWLQEQVQPVIEGRQESHILESIDDYSLLFAHASVTSGGERDQYLFPWKSPLILRDLMETRTRLASDHFCLFLGHTHFPMLAQLKDGEIKFRSIKYGAPIPIDDGPAAINPGSIGQPRDGDPRAAYVLFDSDQRTVTFQRVDYDTWQVAEKLQRELNINKNNRVNRPALNHPLSRDERTTLSDLLDLRTPSVKLMKSVEDAYRGLMNTIQTGDGGTNTVKFSRIYTRPEADLFSNPTQ